MVQDVVTKDFYRADHVLEDVIKKKISDKKTSKESIPELGRETLTLHLRLYSYFSIEDTNP